jgi:hypothetical protein
MKKNDILLILGFAAGMAVINVVLVWTHCLAWEGAWDWKALGTMIGAAVTIAVMSQLYKDNPLFKMAEHMLVGSALGYGLVVAWYSMWVNEIIPGIQPLGQYGWRALWQPMQVAVEAQRPQALGVWSVILPAILGLLMYSRLSKRYAWISRFPFAVMIGFGVGMSIPNEVTANLLQQLKPMMVDLLHDADGNVAPLANWKEIVVFIGVMSTLVYFFFSIEHKGAVGVVSTVGSYFIMIAFGASFGYTVMGRLSLLIGRINYLFQDWIPLIP